jgi:hypothetical protein
VTLLELVGAAGSGVFLTLGAGGLPKVVSAIARWRERKATGDARAAAAEAEAEKARAEADAEVTKAVLDFARDEREQTGKYVVDLVSCKELLASERAKYEARAEVQDAAIALLTVERGELLARVARLERENELMRLALVAAGLIDEAKPEPMPAPVEQPAKVTPIGRFHRKDVP